MPHPLSSPSFLQKGINTLPEISALVHPLKIEIVRLSAIFLQSQNPLKRVPKNLELAVAGCDTLPDAHVEATEKAGRTEAERERCRDNSNWSCADIPSFFRKALDRRAIG